MNTTDTGSIITTSYRVDIIGHIWQPGVGPCAHTVTVDAPMEYARAEGETDLAYELRMVRCAAHHQLRDFQSVDAWQVVRMEEWFEAPEGWTGVGVRPIGETTTHTRKERFTTLAEFDEEEAETWDRAVAGEWEEEEE